MPRLSKIGAAALAAFGWTGLSSVTASYLVVAGGGGAGSHGGGGAGGFLTGTTSLNPTQSYTVTVGAGGAGVVSGASGGGANGVNGSNSQFGTLTASVGGGAGGGYVSNNAGSTGGSGGGGGYSDPIGSALGGAGTSGQGNAGGSGFIGGAGGGGANAVGSNGGGSGSAGVGGAGGNGTASSISGSSVTYAGGGGGGNGDARTGGSGGAGGTGGGGAGSTGTLTTGAAGTANLGGGGGGGGSGSGTNYGGGGNGGSGVVIISYVGAQQFGGGVVTSSGGNTIHTFTTSGTLSPLSSLTASVLVVAGGGAGGGDRGGGGGAGGYRTSSGLTIDTNSIYLVTVGAGGAGVVTSTGNSGSDSQFLSTTSAGGGGGGAGGNGVAGGSGGGGWGSSGSGPFTGGAGNTPSTSPSQGNNGGTGEVLGDRVGGGGGGASAVGTDGTSNGAGGAGTASSISGTSVTYAGGGGGGGLNAPAGTGGAGGGGAGVTSGSGNAGTANLGGGGGGAGDSGAGRSGGAGGSGVVIISYAGSTQQMAGGTVTVSGGNVIHTFTSSGYLAPIYSANNSLRFRASASAYLNRTPPVASNRKTWTWSAWVKRGGLSSNQSLFAVNATGDYQEFRFTSSDNLRLILDAAANNYAVEVPTVVWRDPAAWYHIVLAVDTTQATSTNRVKIYVNGIQQTVSAVSGFSFPAQNFDTYVNATLPHAIGNFNYNNTLYFDGYMTEVQLIDGQALTPNSFGTSNGLGVWQPIRYGGSYGTNGFYLPFTNTTSTTTLGYDFSPNGNNWTTNNISLTAGTTYDSMNDVPTLTSATTANYCTFNPLDASTTAIASNGNLKVTNSSSANTGHSGIFCTQAFPTSGLFYYEIKIDSFATASAGGFVLNGASKDTDFSSSTNLYQYSVNSGVAYANGTTAYTGSTLTTGDILGVAVDTTNGALYFAKNNTWQNSGVPTSGASKTGAISFTVANNILPACYVWKSGGGDALSANFGQRPFSYTPPTGFVALNTFNI